MSIRILLSTRIYPGQCVDQAVLAYSNHFSVRVCNMTARERLIEISALEGSTIDEGKLTHEFLNYLLDVSVESHLNAARTPDHLEL